MDFDIDEKLDRKMLRKQRTGFWYLTGSAPNKAGKMKGFLLGPYVDYEAASRIAERKHLVSWNAVELGTSDLQKAGQLLRAKRLHNDASFADIFERNMHRNVGSQDGV